MKNARKQSEKTFSSSKLTILYENFKLKMFLFWNKKVDFCNCRDEKKNEYFRLPNSVIAQDKQQFRTGISVFFHQFVPVSGL